MTLSSAIRSNDGRGGGGGPGASPSSGGGGGASHCGINCMIFILVLIGSLQLLVGHYAFERAIDHDPREGGRNAGGGRGGATVSGRGRDESGVKPQQQQRQSKLRGGGGAGQRQEQLQKQKQASGEKNNSPSPLSHPSLEQLLRVAGVNVTDDVRSKLPPFDVVAGLYGAGPIIVGLDRCEEFRSSVRNEDGYVGPAGMFNTGTNLMFESLHRNCIMPDRVKKRGARQTGMEWQVPWSKHSPVSWRFRHSAPGSRNVVQKDVLPVVLIKDPYTWMESMCRHPYAANWRHSAEHCPNLVPNHVEYDKGWVKKGQARGDVGIPVNVRYNDTHHTHHKSLVGLWNDWYGGWHDATFPRLMVRFEDMLFHPDEVVRAACACAGGKMKSDEYRHVPESAKGGEKGTGAHAGSSNLATAMIRYSDPSNRVGKFAAEDLRYAAGELNVTLMGRFHYPIAAAAAAAAEPS